MNTTTNNKILLPDLKRQIIVQSTAAVTRAGEGSASLLKNGKILLVYSRFTGGGADHDTSELFGGILDPVTGEIQDGRIFFQDVGAVNQMCVSFERLNDGDLGIVFLRRSAPDEDDVYFSRSPDDGITWSKPVKVNSCCEEKFIVVNCDRLRQFSSGRLAIPAALYPERKNLEKPSSLAMFYSDDGGKSWFISERLRILGKNMQPPRCIHPDAGQIWKDGCSYYAKEQEPGVEELADGRILLYCRTYIGYMYQAYSSDNGQSWTELKASSDIVSPCSPQSIRRIPGSTRLLCIFNDRRNVAYGDPEKFWNWRTPLTLAVSDDNAATWRILGNIEDDSHNYCYTSILFLGDNILLTYYESENTVQDGKPVRRNLASLKMLILNLKQICQH